MNKVFIEKIASKVVDSAFQVHKEIGPGLLESVYELSLLKELEIQGVKHGIKRYVNNY